MQAVQAATALFAFLHGDDMTNKYAVVEDGVVSNIVVASAEFAQSIGAILVGGNVNMGDSWNGSEFIPAPAPVEPVPTFVYPRQIRLALTRVGLRTAVETHVAASGQDLKDWWEFSNEFYRDNPHVIETANALGVNSSQLDDLWRLARSL